MGIKRSAPLSFLQRRVRVRRDEDPRAEADSERSTSEDHTDLEGLDHDSNSNSVEDVVGDEKSQAASEPSDSDGEATASSHADFTSVSFGALAKAQASMPPLDKKSKEPKPSPALTQSGFAKEVTRDKTSSASRIKQLKRTSKHAPQEQSSKRQVSRRREILPDTRRKYRDPRFAPTTSSLDVARAQKAYSFLDDYRDSEMAELRTQIKKTKDPSRKDDLKRQLMSMESRKKAQRKKDEEEKVLDEHRKKEKELVAQGKKPFFLKRSEQKKVFLSERYSSMSSGQVDKAMQRKRKKIAGKEKKDLDFLQRNRHDPR